MLYGVLLAAAYRVGDLSHAYPLMRGTAPLLVAIGSATLIGEQLSRGVWVGVALVSGGIFSMICGRPLAGPLGRCDALALLNACVIAAYTTIDGLGVRVSGQPVAYSLWLSLLVGLPWLIWVVGAAGAHRRARCGGRSPPPHSAGRARWPPTRWRCGR